VTLSNPWARHYQSVWHERTADRRIPLWLRVAFLAFGAHKANGHARFKPGEIGMIFGTVDTETGEIKPVDKANVQRAIRNATQAGWLAEGSSSLCLVVPAHAITGGLGFENEVCPLHERTAARRRKPSGNHLRAA
jgi:hypothetical protein